MKKFLLLPLLLSLTACMSFNKVELGDLFKKEPRFYSAGGTEGSKNQILVLPLRGMIIPYAPKNSFWQDNYISPEQVAQSLMVIKHMPGVKALVLEIQSPGGSAAASEEILQMFKDFKKETKIPIVAYFGEVAGSGGYYIAQAADKIIANPNNLTGSIGVISIFPNVGNFLKNKLDIEVVTIKSGQFKDAGSFLRKMSDDEKEYWQSMTMMYYDRFVEVVAEGRKLSTEKVRKVADGRVYHPKIALEKGLIDQIGHFDTAMKAAEVLGHSPDSAWLKLALVSPPAADGLAAQVGVTIPNMPNVDMSHMQGVKFWYLMNQ